jgi:hypothetical protein
VDMGVGTLTLVDGLRQRMEEVPIRSIFVTSRMALG